MRFVSNANCPPDEITVVAILETLLSVVGTFALCIWLGNFSLLATWSVIGWTLLLHNERSNAFSLPLFEPVYETCLDTLDDYNDGDGFTIIDYDGGIYTPVVFLLNSALALIAIACCLVALIGWALICKLYGTVRALASAPVESFLAIPRNWRNAAFSLDLGQPFEFVPGHRQWKGKGKGKGRRYSLNLREASIPSILRGFTDGTQLINFVLGLFSAAALWAFVHWLGDFYLFWLKLRLSSVDTANINAASILAWVGKIFLGIIVLVGLGFGVVKAFAALKRRFPKVDYWLEKLAIGGAIVLGLAGMVWNIVWFTSGSNKAGLLKLVD